MKLLFIEDEPELHSQLQESLSGRGIDIDIASTSAAAIAKVKQGGYDLYVCDLKIPPSEELSAEADKRHGISTFDQIRLNAPGTPVIIFSGFGDLSDLGDRLSEADRQNLYGLGPEKLAVSRKKSQLRDVLGLIEVHRAGLEYLRGVEISGAEAVSVMSAMDARLLAIHARMCGGVAVRATLLAGGKSAALTALIEVERADGTKASRMVAKLNDLSEVEDEEARYNDHVSPSLAAATYTHRHVTLKAGAQTRGAILYSLADEFKHSLFEVLSSGKAAAVVEGLQQITAPWHAQSTVLEVPVGDVRRLLLPDDRLTKLGDIAQWATPELEALTIRTRWSATHGDLHGGNILISQDMRPILIDFGRTARGVNTLDPVSLEVSAVLHPDSAWANSEWPSTEQAEQWHDLSAYLENCPDPEFVKACRSWSDSVGAGDREANASLYSYALRQLSYEDVDSALASAFSRGAAERIAAGFR